jgi:hypothetical protein
VMLISTTKHEDTDVETSHVTTQPRKVMAGPAPAPPLPVSTDDGRTLMSVDPKLLKPGIIGEQQISSSGGYAVMCTTPCTETSVEGLPRCKCHLVPATSSTP